MLLSDQLKITQGDMINESIKSIEQSLSKLKIVKINHPHDFWLHVDGGGLVDIDIELSEIVDAIPKSGTRNNK